LSSPKTTVTLRIFGDELEPAHLTKMLGITPTNCYRMGDVRTGRTSGKQYKRKTGGWILDTNDRTDGDLDSQIDTLFNQLPKEETVWAILKKDFELNLFCGVFLNSGNDGFELRPSTLAMLGQRDISLWLDVYDFAEDDE